MDYIFILRVRCSAQKVTGSCTIDCIIGTIDCVVRAKIS